MATVALEKLKSLTTDQLYELNRAVVGMIRQRQTERQVEAGSRFTIGGKAAFRSSKTGRLVTIQVVKINPKSVKGHEIDATGKPDPLKVWRVAPSLLSRVAE